VAQIYVVVGLLKLKATGLSLSPYHSQFCVCLSYLLIGCCIASSIIEHSADVKNYTHQVRYVNNDAAQRMQICRAMFSYSFKRDPIIVRRRPPARSVCSWLEYDISFHRRSQEVQFVQGRRQG